MVYLFLEKCCTYIAFLRKKGLLVSCNGFLLFTNALMDIASKWKRVKVILGQMLTIK